MMDPVLEQKIVIDNNVKCGNVNFLLNLIREIHEEQTDDPQHQYVNDLTSSRRDILCELSAALLRYNAVDVFNELCIRYDGAADLPNLPAFNGRNIIDLAGEYEMAGDLKAAIERAGGVSFPIILRSVDAQNHFLQWHREGEKPGGNLYFQSILMDEAVTFEDTLNVLAAGGVELTVREDWCECEDVIDAIDLITMGTSIDASEKSDLQTLAEIIAGKEQWSLAIELRNIIKRCDQYAPVQAQLAAPQP